MSVMQNKIAVIIRVIDLINNKTIIKADETKMKIAGAGINIQQITVSVKVTALINNGNNSISIPAQLLKMEEY